MAEEREARLTRLVLTVLAVVPLFFAGPAGAARPTDSAYFAAACPTAHTCVVVGYAGDSAIVRQRHRGRWTTVATPSASGALSSIACLGKKKCVAVGHRLVGGAARPLAEVRAGPRWRLTGAPSPSGSVSTSLESVACSTISDCWAVGSYSTGGVARHTLAEHWDGRRWRIVAAVDPKIRGRGNDLDSVSCVPDRRCVAVGTRGRGTSGSVAFAETWTGRAWRLANTPALAGNSLLNGVGCSPAHSVLCMSVGAMTSGAARPLAEKWTGSRWRRGLPRVAAGHSGDRFNAVACASSTRCFAVGSDAGGRVLTESWHRGWTVTPAASPRHRENGLTGVSCATATNCLAVGYTESTSGASRPLAERWTGTSWRLLSG